jgi:two-component system, cell cycle sensor histidine kinase and response regulator CckA
VEAVHSGQRARRTVLVVEDDSDQRALTAQMLARHGFTVLPADSGPSALALSRSHPGTIDLLLTVSLMRAMSGVEVAEAVRREHPGITVIYMSEFAPDAFDAARPRALLLKPFGEAQLLDVVRRSLPD